MAKQLTIAQLTTLPCALCGLDSPQLSTSLFSSTAPKDIDERLFSARRLPDQIHFEIIKCKNDGLIRARHQLSEKQLEALYKNSEITYNQEIPYLQKSYLDSLSPILKTLPKEANILEIGCGNGFVLEGLDKMGFTSLHGIEASQSAQQFVSSKLKKKIVFDNFFKTTLPKNSFDFIFFFQTLDHMTDPNLFLDRCYELLKRGGQIFSLHHNVQSTSANLLGESSPIYDIEHPYLYSQKTTRCILEKNGFIVDSVESPSSQLSINHLIHLSPIPLFIKNPILFFFSRILSPIGKIPVTLQLGNLAALAHKP